MDWHHEFQRHEQGVINGWAGSDHMVIVWCAKPTSLANDAVSLSYTQCQIVYRLCIGTAPAQEAMPVFTVFAVFTVLLLLQHARPLKAVSAYS